MSSDLFVVNENDLVDFVIKVMKWNHIHHIPVVNSKNKIVGIISSRIIDNLKNDKLIKLTAKNIMNKNFEIASPETSVIKAKDIMEAKGVTCLPIIEDDELIGIFTNSDLNKIQTQRKSQ